MSARRQPPSRRMSCGDLSNGRPATGNRRRTKDRWDKGGVARGLWPVGRGPLQLQLRRAARLDRFVQEPDERCQGHEGPHQLRIEPVAAGELGRKLAESEELLVPEVLGGRMVLGVTRGYPRQLIALQLAQHVFEVLPRDDALQSRMR